MRHNEAVLIILILTIVLLYAQSVLGQGDNSSSRETLRGLKAIGVHVTLSESCEKRGYVEAVLQNEAELQLRMAGIKILPRDETQATFRVMLLCYELTREIKGYVYTQESWLAQWIKWPPSRPTTSVEVITWRSFSSLGAGGGRNEQDVRDAMYDSIRQFVNAWLSVNR